MDADVLATQGARASATMILTMLNRNDTVPTGLGLINGFTLFLYLCSRCKPASCLKAVLSLASDIIYCYFFIIIISVWYQHEQNDESCCNWCKITRLVHMYLWTFVIYLSSIYLLYGALTIYVLIYTTDITRYFTIRIPMSNCSEVNLDCSIARYVVQQRKLPLTVQGLFHEIWVTTVVRS